MRFFRRSAPLALAAVLAAPFPLVAEPPSLELAMSDPVWIGRAPERGWWDDDGATVYAERQTEDGIGTELLAIDVATGETRPVPEAERGVVPRPSGPLATGTAVRTWEADGDVFWRVLPAGPVRQLTRTTGRESDPLLVGDSGRRIAFRRGDSWFLRDLDSGMETELAALRTEKDPAEKDAEEDLDWLAEQQLRLFEVVREDREDRLAERALDAERRRLDPTRPAQPWYLGEEVTIVASALSPSGDHLVVVTESAKRDLGKRDRMPRWVTESGYVEVDEVRPKVGTGADEAHSLLLLDLATGEKTPIELDLLPGITDRPLEALRAENARETVAETEGRTGSDDAAESGGNEAAGEEPGPRAVEVEGLEWSPDGSRVAVTAHSLDNKDRWIFLVTPGAEPLVRPIHRLSHDAWINWYFNDVGWLPDARRLWYLSEESGWSQLYLHDLDSDATRRLTDGDFVVGEPELAPDGGSILYMANPDDPTVWELFRVEIDSGTTHQLTDLDAGSSKRWPPTSDLVVPRAASPDGQKILFAHSTATRPPELWVAGPDGSDPRPITATVSEAFQAVDWVAPVHVEIPSSEAGRPLHARFYPPAPDGPMLGAAVLFVHGAGYLQNAHRGWSGYFREFMFHTVLANRGIAVLDLDYRGSAGYGAAWRTAIYRRMGHPELVDLQDGVGWLVENHGIDRDRVGVYGGSYGGFLTLMALFREPDLFACGAALRPVTDWAHYNHPYTANILNSPELDPEAYRRSSPIEFAEGLEAPLLIAAPMLDDNVFFQDTVRLSQRLIELGKTGWNVALYPVEPHGFVRPSSWLDEYRRIESLFLEHLAPESPGGG